MNKPKAMQNSGTGMAVLVGVGVKPRTDARLPFWKIDRRPQRGPEGEGVAQQGPDRLHDAAGEQESRMKVVTTIIARVSSRRELMACLASTRAAVDPPTMDRRPGWCRVSRTRCWRSWAAPEDASSPVLRFSPCAARTVGLMKGDPGDD